MIDPDQYDIDSIDVDHPTDDDIAYLSKGATLRVRVMKKGTDESRKLIESAIAQERAERSRNSPLAATGIQVPIEDMDLIPDVYESNLGDDELDRVIDGITLPAAYERWINKSQIRYPLKSGDGNKISCPVPGHLDTHPSAWFDTDSGLWFCGTCNVGGDKFDMAAIGKNYDFPDAYKTNGTFPQLRRDMAADFGYIVTRSNGKTVVSEMETVYEVDPAPEDDLTPPVGSDNPAEVLEGAPDLEPNLQNEVPDPVEVPTPSAPPPTPTPVGPDVFLRPETGRAHVDDDGPGADVVDLHPDPEVKRDLSLGMLDWESIVPRDTLVGEYMFQNCRYDIPHEYHWWLILQAIGFANGFHIRLDDVPPINGNLYVVLVGHTGLGKSRATQPMRTLVREVMPWTGSDDLPGTGVKVLGGLESGQALVKGIRHEYLDPASSVPGAMVEQPNIRGWTIPEEFSSFIKKSMRTGSDFKERAIEFYDVGRTGEVALTAIKHGGELKATGPFLQITSTTQPEAIHTYLGIEDIVSGYLNRFIFVTGPSRAERPARWMVADAPDLTLSVEYLKAIIQFCEAHDGELVTYTPDGSLAWEQMYARLDKLKEDTGPMAVRIDLILKKVMLAMCMNEHRMHIDAEMVERMEPVLSHLLVNYTQITGDLYWRADDSCQDAILTYVTKKNEAGAYPRKKEIVDSVKRPMQGRGRFDISRALDTLEKLEILTIVKVKNARGPDRSGYKVGGIIEAAGGYIT